uniref:Uncharacterized protein n=1 Tax=Candidozyma auris TaxID=498019 RepID=A0A0L0P8R5_CANAR
MISSSSLPREGARDQWRSDRPKTSLTASGPPPRSYGSSRYNANSIPVSGRDHHRGSGALSHSGPDFKRERYDYDNDDSNRWKLTYSSRDKPRSLTGSRPYKEKRSSSLTNSVGGLKRGDSYYPSKGSAYPSGINRYQDRYTDRYTERRHDSDDVKPGYDADEYVTEEASADDVNKLRYQREEIIEDGVRDKEDEDMKDDEYMSDKETTANDWEDTTNVDSELEAKKISESVVHDLKSMDGGQRRHSVTREEDSSPQEVDGEKLHKIHITEEEGELKVKVEAPSEPPSSEHTQSKDLTTSTLSSIDELKMKQVTKEDLASVDYPAGCFAPLTELDTKLQQLSFEFRFENSQNDDGTFLRFRLAKPLKNIQEYPFYLQNLSDFASKYKRISEILGRRERDMKKRRLSLWMKYNELQKENDERREKLDEQLKVLHPSDDEARKELESIDIRVKNNDQVSDAQSPTEPQPPAGRRGRRHGDLVTTEAEFQEILKSLENELNEDPLIKAQRVSATIPDLILDPVERQSFVFMDSNNIVHDKEKWASRIKSDFMDNFTEREHDAFCEAFCRAPKRFGQISKIIGGLRTPEECVVHYYMTKKAVNYKYLVSQFKKRSARKPSRRKSKLKEQEASETTDVAPLEGTDSSKETEAMTPDVPSLEPAEEVKRRRGATLLSEELARAISGEDDAERPPKKKARRRKDEEVQVSVDDKPTEQPPSVAVPHVEGAYPGAPSAQVSPQDGLANGSVADDKRKTITSYWSITEVNEFPRLLAQYGSKWSIISKMLGTKTPTMVRNYYQRNAAKNGWQQLVLDADGRLGGGFDTHAQLSNVDATIVVKPQRRPDENPLGRRQEEHVNGSFGSATVAAPPPPAPPRMPEIPVGTFQHPYPSSAFPPKRASVGSLLSGPVPVMYEQTPYASTIPPATAPATAPAPVTLPPVLPASQAQQPAKHGGVKPSIMSLLNADSTGLLPPPMSAPTASPPPPQQPQISTQSQVCTQPVQPAPAPAPVKAPKPGNLASLLNAASSPLRAPEAEESKPEPPKPTPRKNSIKSLLHDL